MKYFWCFLLFLFVFGIIIRIDLSNEYTNSEGIKLTSNPDGLYWLSEPEENEQWFKYSFDWRYNSLIYFMLSVLIGLFLLKKDKVKMGVFTGLCMFCPLVFNRSSMGFYDHDTMGLFLIFVIIFLLNKKYYAFLPLVLVLLYYIWDGIVLGIFILIFIVLIRRVNWKIRYVSYLVILGIILYKKINSSLFISENAFAIGPIVLISPLIVYSLYSCIKKKYLFNESLIVFCTILLLHSSRLIILAYPILFLSYCSISEFKKNKIFHFLCILFLLIPLINGYEVQNRWGDEQTDEAMYFLRDNVSKKSVILSWWDNGYYIEYMTGKEALFDNGNNGLGDTQLSHFFCTGKQPDYTFDYFVIFKRDKKIMNSILKYNGYRCNFSNTSIKLPIVFQNEQVKILKPIEN